MTEVYLLFIGYSIDLLWLFICFVYAFVLAIGEHYGVITNVYLKGRRAYICLLLIASWFYYVYADYRHAYEWLQQSPDTITSADIYEKAIREWLSAITSILTTLLIMGCKFKRN